MIRVDVTFMAAERLSIEPGIGVIIGRFKLKTEPFPSKAFWHLKIAAIPPLLITKPLSLAAVDLGCVKPLRMDAAWNFDAAPAVSRGSSAFLTPGQFPIAIEGKGFWYKWFRGRCWCLRLEFGYPFCRTLDERG